jgi:hypothetical protein
VGCLKVSQLFFSVRAGGKLALTCYLLPVEGNSDHQQMRQRNAELLASGVESVQEQQHRCAFISHPREAKWVMEVPDEEIVVFSPCKSP